MSAKKAHNKRPRKPVPSKSAPQSRPKQGKASPRSPRSTARAKKPLSPLEVQLRKALAEMGLARARRVFAAVEASFDD
ncbi:MAG TPA: hypothetical protein VEQ58_05395 [Polyangiaceae bacterium]|nr:hypothetical protein [Polyangiaceae bacterium]